MHLHPGIPLVSDLKSLQQNEIFKNHLDFNRNFLQTHGQALAGYGSHWGEDPLKLWSRRWEYPFAAESVLRYAAEQGDRPLKMLDAGSGVTYFPYMLCQRLPNLQVICVDYDQTYVEMFQKVNAATPNSRVSFTPGMLQSLQLDSNSLDIVACISVLEHTDNYAEILKEFARVLKPGGLLTITFDLSLDGKFKLTRKQASDLLSHLTELFSPEDGADVEKELSRMDNPDGLLTTRYVQQHEPEYLPWRYPYWVMALRDLVKGQGWTGGFRFKSVYCLSARRK